MKVKINVCRDYIILGEQLHKKFYIQHMGGNRYSLYDKSAKLCGWIAVDSQYNIIEFTPNHELFKSLMCKTTLYTTDTMELIKLSNKIIHGNCENATVKNNCNIITLIFNYYDELGFNVAFDYETIQLNNEMITRLNRVYIV